MIGGFNHNIRHQNRVFHVQTEDLGLPNAQLRTHIFFNGMVVAQSQQSYQDLQRFTMTPQQRAAQIRARMQDLHKNSLRLLLQGAYDQVIQQRLQTTQAPQQTMPTAPPSAAVDDPELGALLRQAQTTRPSANQTHPSFLSQTVPAIESEKEPAPSTPPSTATKDNAKDEKIAGRAQRLFPRREKKKETISEAERLSNARISRSESSLVKNRKKAKPKEQKENEAKLRAQDAARSRGQTPKNTKAKTEQKTAEITNTDTKKSPPASQIASQSPGVPPSAVAQGPTATPPRPQPAPPRPQVAAAAIRPGEPAQHQSPLSNRPVTRPPAAPPAAAGVYPLQPLPNRTGRPLTPASTRPPVAAPSTRPMHPHAPPPSRSYPPAPSQPPMPPYPGQGHKPQ